ncbi:MAG: hypothetical protein EPO19_04670 [Betaproteobacteria bacterium]|nr:MAG: hypothetical protein EPO19_04670 [Betaproteobacteria bacterium]
MRRVIFTMLLSIVSSSAAAAWEQWFVPKSNLSEWVVANYNEAVTIYADTATVRRAGNMAQMWDLTDFRTGKALSGDKRSLSFRKEQEYDCSGQRARILYISWHSENMGTGEILGSDRTPGDWRPVLRGTILERLWTTACGK